VPLDWFPHLQDEKIHQAKELGKDFASWNLEDLKLKASSMYLTIKDVAI